MPSYYVIRLADGTHLREPPPDHPNQDTWCKGQMAARKFLAVTAAQAVIKQRNLKGAAVVPYWYNRPTEE